ncbi:MAG: (2Fe-2S)-binding protein [Spirochaetales bacterium]|nr:(2Fe-2S)-binding protein [Spirochaetales bacterium]
MRISFTVNGNPVVVEAEPLARLLDVLRIDLGLHGVKEGCGEGECGACAVLLNGRIVNSCVTPVAAAADGEILTIEGFCETDRYAVIEQAFSDSGGVQCGFCTPGFVMATEALLRENSKPSEDEIRRGLSGNLCRCTGYNMIVQAVQAASETLNGQ